MSFALPQLRVGQPVSHESLAVFPLFAEPNGRVGYVLSDEALSAGSLVVQEISEHGSVPDLSVENKGEIRVLFLEGEELVGAKQNRILNTSVLIAARSKTTIPVSCVEQGRWRYRSRQFGSSGSHSPSKLRRALKSSVSQSVKEQRGHRSDQGEIWREVSQLHSSHGVASETHAMADAFESHQDRIAEFHERVGYVEGATGLAVAVGPRIVAVDVFDKPATCQKVWKRLLSGVVFDALEETSSSQAPSVADVERLLGTVQGFPWERTQTVGEGEEHRAETPRRDFASALVYDDSVIHASVLVGE